MDKNITSPFGWGEYHETITNQLTVFQKGVDSTFVNDAIDTALGKISLVDNNNLTYSLMVDEHKVGTINIPEDQFLNNVVYDVDTQNLVFTFKADEQKESVSVNLSTLVDTYRGGNGVIVNADGTIDIDQSVMDNYATKDDIKQTINAANFANANVCMLLSRLSQLEDKVSQMRKTNIEVVDMSDFEESVINDASKDVVLNGGISNNLTITAKSTELKNCEISNAARVNINGGDVVLNNVTYSGAFPKANGNAISSFDNVADVVIKNTVFDSNVSAYNGIEIGLRSTELPASILIDNCSFSGAFSNIPILVFGTKDNSNITINNCNFNKVSNVLRLSNKTNCKCVVNFVNCEFTELEADLRYTGVVMCQNYTSTSATDAQESKLFGSDKITINFVNCSCKGEKINMPANIADVCGSKNASQLVYVYYDKGGFQNYSEDTYPTVTIV